MYKPFYEDRVSKLRLEIENKKMSTEQNTGKKQTELGSLMAVMKDTNHIKKQVITNSTTGVYSKKEGESIDPYVTLRHQNPKGKDTGHFGGALDQHHDNIEDQSNYKGGESKVSLLFENPIESAQALLP